MTDWSTIPTTLLAKGDTRSLLDWLARRGLRMSLADLDAERIRRGVEPPMRRNSRSH